MTAGDVAAAGRHFRCALAFSEAFAPLRRTHPRHLVRSGAGRRRRGHTAAALAGARKAIESARPLAPPAYLVMALLRAAQADRAS